MIFWNVEAKISLLFPHTSITVYVEAKFVKGGKGRSEYKMNLQIFG